MKTEKIGEINYEDFKTEFILTSKVKEYLEKELVSTASLLPNGWEWYEAELFDFLDDNHTGKINKRYGKEFEVIYYGIIERKELVKDWSDENSEVVKEKGFYEDLRGLDEDKNFLYDSTMQITGTPEHKNKKFEVKYIVRIK
jgi:hypothetical protein